MRIEFKKTNCVKCGSEIWKMFPYNQEELNKTICSICEEPNKELPPIIFKGYRSNVNEK